jgi:hypothetical protein
MYKPDWFSVVSFVISFFAIVWTWLTDRKLKRQQLQINEFQLQSIKDGQAEKKQALLRAKGYQDNRIWVVKIWNEGVSVAKNIRLSSEDIEKDDKIQLRLRSGKIPYPLLNRGDSFEIYATLSEGRNPVPKIKLIWDDDYKKDNEREQVLEF